MLKQAAQVDILTGGKFRLGVGLGWNQVEYEALGQDFKTRGRRIDEQSPPPPPPLDRALVHLHGRVRPGDRRGPGPAAGAAPDPRLVRRPVATNAYRRVGRLADGWFPQVAPGPKLAEAKAAVDEAATAAGRDPATLGMEGRLSWQGDPDALAALAAQWRDNGATHISINTMNARASRPWTTTSPPWKPPPQDMRVTVSDVLPGAILVQFNMGRKQPRRRRFVELSGHRWRHPRSVGPHQRVRQCR